MQSAISGHWSQSIGTDLSGQHGMSAAISAISAAAIGAALPMAMPAFAGAGKRGEHEPCDQEDRQQPGKVERYFHPGHVLHRSGPRTRGNRLRDHQFGENSRHSGPRHLARARNPSGRIRRRPIDSGLALRAPRNDAHYMPVIRGASTHHGFLKRSREASYIWDACRGASPRRRETIMNYFKTAILLAGLTGLFMGVGYLIGGKAAP